MGPDGYRGCWADGYMGWLRDGGAGGWGGCGGAVGYDALCRWAMGTEAVGGGVPAEPWWRPTSNVSRGPSGLPMLSASPSVMSTAGTRWLWTYMPLRLPLSTAIQRPWS